jgi:methyl-accepting chemotaxis protein
MIDSEEGRIPTRFALVEQAMGALSKGVTQMDSVVQQNAASIEELAATAEELAGQASSLSDTMRFFESSKEAPRPA